VSPTIAIVDDDPAVRRSLTAILSTYDLETVEFCSGKDFLSKKHKHRLDCILLDIRMPGIDGLALQRELRKQHELTPVIIITGHGDIPLAVRAMREGAFDFIEKPVRDDLLTASIEAALENISSAQNTEELQIGERMGSLTPREREVMQLVVEGHSSTAIGAILNISSRTADHHRARVLEKLGATSVANLIRLVLLHQSRGPQTKD
jgi:FixJ family two-component response regulator